MANQRTNDQEEIQAPKLGPTWQEKLEQGLPLSPLEEVKADADFNYKRRLREEKEKRDFEESKNRPVNSNEAKTLKKDAKEQADEAAGTESKK